MTRCLGAFRRKKIHNCQGKLSSGQLGELAVHFLCLGFRDTLMDRGKWGGGIKETLMSRGQRWMSIEQPVLL